MKALIVACVMLSTSVFASPGERDSKATREDRKKARVERKFQRKQQPFDQRTQEQKRRDRNVLLVLAIGAGLVVKGLSGAE